RARIKRESSGANNGHTCCLQSVDLTRAIRHKHDRLYPKLLKDGCSARILAGICSIAQMHIRLSLRQSLLLESAAAHQRQTAITSPVLIEPDNNPSALLLNHRLRQLHLLTTIAVDAIEEMCGNAV